MSAIDLKFLFFRFIFIHLSFGFVFIGSHQTLSESVPEQIKKEFRLFLESDIEKARSMLSEFSSAELEIMWNHYKQNKTLREKRTLWLIEEHHARKADEVATSRLVYLFLAVVFLFIIMIIFLQTIISQQKKILSK